MAVAVLHESTFGDAGLDQAFVILVFGGNDDGNRFFPPL